ncbi:MAG: hypothetical protein IAG10_12555 [Planctomycetaceae bacterium]|nr:hypothetical protein [Planctomycetaceae bacterium]
MKAAFWCLLLVVSSALFLGAMFAPQESEVVDEHSSKTEARSATTVLQNSGSSAAERESAAQSLIRGGTSTDLRLLNETLWQSDLSLATRCAIAVKLVELEVPEGLEFLLAQYDLYRLERRMTSRFTMDPVRNALEQLESTPLLTALEQRLKTERDLKMQNNIRTLMDRVRLNQQPLDELQLIAADTDWKAGMYRRYPAIEQIGRRGGPEMIPFLKSLKPWQSDHPNNDKHVEGQNNVILPEQVGRAVAAIEARHDSAATKNDNREGSTEPRTSPRLALTQPEEVRVFRGHTAPVQHLAVSPDGKFFVSVAYGHRRDSSQPMTNEWIIWDVATGKALHQGRDPGDQPRRNAINPQFAVRDAVFLPESQSLVTVGREHTIRDCKTGQPLKQLDGQKLTLPIVGVTLSPDGKQAFGWSSAVGKFAIWDIATGSRRMFSLEDSRLAEFLADGRLLLTGGPSGNRVRIFDIERGRLENFFSGEPSTAGRLRVSPDGMMAATTIEGEGSVALWDIAGQQLRAQTNRGSCACFAPDNQHLLIGRFDGTVSLARRATVDEQLGFTAQRDVILDVAFLPDGQHILTAGGGGFPAYADEANADYAVRCWRLPDAASRAKR